MKKCHLGRSRLSLAGLLFLYSFSLSAAETVKIRAQELANLAIFPTESAPATVLSLNDSTLSAETAGRVTDIVVRVGDQVTEGQQLLSLGCLDQRVEHQQAKAELTRTEAALELSKRQLKRAKVLVDQNSISEELVDQRENEVILAEAQRNIAHAGISAARLNVDRCQIQSPFPAIVMERLTQIGAWVKVGTPVLRVMDIGQLEVSAQIPAGQTAGFERAGKLWLEDNGHQYPLTLRSVVAAIDSRARSREARLEFTDAQALPGTAGRLVWQDQRPHVPADLLVQRQDQLGVFVVDGNKARFVVLPQAREGTPAPAGELKTGQWVIIDGRYGLQDGDLISK